MDGTKSCRIHAIKGNYCSSRYVLPAPVVRPTNLQRRSGYSDLGRQDSVIGEVHSGILRWTEKFLDEEFVAVIVLGILQAGF